MMDEFYRNVLRTHYAHMSQRSRDRIAEFYNTLPAPDSLTKEWILTRLERLAVGSRSVYLSFLRPVTKQLNIDISDLKSRASKPHVKRSDLYTSEEIEKMIQGCGETRNKAIVAVLYESAFRAFELLSLRFDDIRAGQDLWWLSVKGKRAIIREVPIRYAIPALQAWLEVHPTGTGPIFVSFRFPYGVLKYRSLRALMVKIQKRAGVHVRRCPVHLFRHTRLTELATKLREAELRIFAGWEPGSAMPRTYVHLAGEDLDTSFRRMYDLAQEPTKQMMKMEGIVCPRCKTQNGPSARFCMNCSLVLDDELAMQLKQDETMRESVAQSLLIGEISHKDIREIIREEVRRALGLPSDLAESEPDPAPL
jgi:integrase